MVSSHTWPFSNLFYSYVSIQVHNKEFLARAATTRVKKAISARRPNGKDTFNEITCKAPQKICEKGYQFEKENREDQYQSTIWYQRCFWKILIGTLTIFANTIEFQTTAAILFLLFFHCSYYNDVVFERPDLQTLLNISYYCNVFSAFNFRQTSLAIVAFDCIIAGLVIRMMMPI